MSEPSAKVLVIDDERGPRESLRMLLKKQFEVCCADSVDAGTEAVQAEKPDVIIMDIRMPRKSGIDGLAEIRELDSDVSIIMLTGYAALETAQSAIRLGANEYMQKPFDANEMISTVHRHARRAQLCRKRSQTEQELNALKDAVEAQIAKEAHMASLGVASSALVHDLRNPLAIVLGYVEILNDELQSLSESGNVSLSPDASTYMECIEHNLDRCRKLTDTWQQLGKTDESGWETVEVSAILQRLAGDMRHLHRTGAVRIEMDASGGSCPVRGDATQLHRSFQNLISNAVDAVTQVGGGTVRVFCTLEGEHVVIRIEDNGCGVAMDDLEWIFQPFNTKKGLGKGTGLGLFISKKVIDNHRGNMTFQSELHKGTLVSVRLPARRVS